MARHPEGFEQTAYEGDTLVQLVHTYWTPASTTQALCGYTEADDNQRYFTEHAHEYRAMHNKEVVGEGRGDTITLVVEFCGHCRTVLDSLGLSRTHTTVEVR